MVNENLTLLPNASHVGLKRWERVMLQYFVLLPVLRFEPTEFPFSTSEASEAFSFTETYFERLCVRMNVHRTVTSEHRIENEFSYFSFFDLLTVQVKLQLEKNRVLSEIQVNDDELSIILDCFARELETQNKNSGLFAHSGFIQAASLEYERPDSPFSLHSMVELLCGIVLEAYTLLCAKLDRLGITSNTLSNRSCLTQSLSPLHERHPDQSALNTEP